MKLPGYATGIAALAAFAAITSTAQAASVVPPGNSAATQYTATFPTVGGEAQVNSEIDGGGTPKHVLGHGKAEKLESKGPAGKAVAAVTAATAPRPVAQPKAAPEPAESSPHGHGKSAAGGSGKGGGGGSGGGSNGHAEDGSKTQAAPGGVTGETLEAGGSSGFGEVLSQATDSSSGRLGIFLPLILIGTVICSFAYLWRRRRPVA
jgi:hypothetical protein